MAAADSDDRGRDADKPSDIPARGAKDIALRVKDEIRKDHVSLVAAGLSYYAMFAVFPALIAFISIYGLIVSPEEAQRQVSQVLAGLPPEASGVVGEQVTRIASTSSTALGWAAVVSIAAALWAASSGTQQLSTALTLVYDEEEDRNFIALRATALALTLGMVVVGLVVLGLIAVVPLLLDAIQLGGIAGPLVSGGRWVVLALVAVFALGAIYRFAPARNRPRWRWVTWGSAIATVLWLVASALFSFYVSNFASYNETYGSLGGVIVLMLWLYLTGFMILLGAEINAEMEHQTARDTTVGPEEPMGEREAQMADTVGRKT